MTDSEILTMVIESIKIILASDKMVASDRTIQTTAESDKIIQTMVA